MAKKENRFQAELKKKLKETFPGCIVMKNDAGEIQGIPDLTVLYGEKWAMLECKRSNGADHRPNQDYYIQKADEMGFGRFVYPENVEEVIGELEGYFENEQERQ